MAKRCPSKLGGATGPGCLRTVGSTSFLLRWADGKGERQGCQDRIMSRFRYPEQELVLE